MWLVNKDLEMNWAGTLNCSISKDIDSEKGIQIFLNQILPNNRHEKSRFGTNLLNSD